MGDAEFGVAEIVVAPGADPTGTAWTNGSMGGGMGVTLE
jgi:hypothetical protein